MIKKRPINSFRNELLNTFSLISYTGKFNIVGSASLSSTQYASDYDLNETIIEKSNIDDACNHIVKMFQSMFKKLNSDENIYVMDFKCGLDNDLVFKACSSIHDFKKYLKEKHNDKLITNEQYKILSKLKTLDEINDNIRDLFILRWNNAEIQAGYKQLSNNRKKLLSSCLLDDSIIKLDIIANIDNFFVEISNIYNFQIKGVRHTTDNIETSLNDDITYYIDKRNYYKALKRLLSLYKLKNTNNKMISALILFFNSNIGLLYKISSDMNVLIDVLEQDKKPVDKKSIIKELQTLKSYLGQIYEVDMNKNIFAEIDKICMHTGDKSTMKQEIFNISAHLLALVQNKTKDFIKNNSALNHIFSIK